MCKTHGHMDTWTYEHDNQTIMICWVCHFFLMRLKSGICFSLMYNAQITKHALAKLLKCACKHAQLVSIFSHSVQYSVHLCNSLHRSIFINYFTQNAGTREEQKFSLIIIYQCEKLGKNVNLTDILIAFSKSKAGVRLKIYLRKLRFSFILNPLSAQCEYEILCRYVQRVIIMTEAKRASNSIVEPRILPQIYHSPDVVLVGSTNS